MNRSTYKSKMLRDESPAAPATLPSNRVMHVIGTVHGFWLDHAASEKRLESTKKRQAASRKAQAARQQARKLKKDIDI